MAAVFAIALPARADQRYALSGSDRYRIGSSNLQSDISYSGTQQLTVRRSGAQTHFRAVATFVRSDDTGRTTGRAAFEQILTSAGELQDKSNGDPDYLTVLNQPFAIELDAQTMHDLSRLQGRLPFDFPAPVMGGTLHGFLRRGASARVADRPALSVDFDASGPMAGPLPDRAAMTMSGTMRMRGTAYYATEGDPILLALTETLTISGTLKNGSHSSPVTITYERTIKAQPSPPRTEASSH